MKRPAQWIKPRLVFWTIAAAVVLAGFARGQDEAKAKSQKPVLLGQPRADFQARRLKLMKEIRRLVAESASESQELRGPRSRGGGGDVETVPVVVLVGQDARAFSVLADGKYRQKNDFHYLTGVEAPSAAVILLPNEAQETLYLAPNSRSERSLEPEAEDGPGPEAVEKFGFQRVESTERFLADLFSAVADPIKRSFRRKREAVVYTLDPSDHMGMAMPNLMPGGDAAFVRFLKEGAPNTQIKDLSPILAEMRKAKTEAEVALIQQAIDITGAAQREVVQTIRPGIFEYELEGKILGAFTALGSQRPGFGSIVGSGPNSTIPHYFANRRQLEDGDLVVVDIGAEYNYYTADITRTYPASGKFSPRQREIYQLVLDAQSACAAQMKPGETRLGDMTRWTRDYLKQSPLRAKDRDGKEQSMEHFFIHGLGHYLGMDVHDVGKISEPIQPGEVFTIEPGIYIPGENLGVRIEDDYVMTDHGVEKLSKAIPSDPDEIERLIEQARAEGGRPRRSEKATAAEGR